MSETGDLLRVIFFLDQELPHQPDLQQVEGVVYNHHAPGGVGAGGKVVLPDPAHPVADEVSAVLQEVKPKQDEEGQPAPTGKEHHTGRPDCAVNGARKGQVFFVLGHPVGLQKIVAYQMPQKGERESFHGQYFTGFCEIVSASRMTIL